jgi:hypothetical protein
VLWSVRDGKGLSNPKEQREIETPRKHPMREAVL